MTPSPRCRPPSALEPAGPADASQGLYQHHPARAPTRRLVAKPYFRVAAQGHVERTSAPVAKDLLGVAERVKFTARTLDPATARARREADELFDQMVRWAKHQPTSAMRGERTVQGEIAARYVFETSNRKSTREVGTNDARTWLHVNFRATITGALKLDASLVAQCNNPISVESLTWAT